MQQRHMETIASPEFGLQGKYDETLAGMDVFDILDDDYARRIASQTTNLPEGQRTPTRDEVAAMRTYAHAYKKQHPKAKLREVTSAVKRKFNVNVLPNTL